MKKKLFASAVALSILLLGCSESVSPLANLGTSVAALASSSSKGIEVPSGASSSLFVGLSSSAISIPESSSSTASSSSTIHIPWIYDDIIGYPLLWDLTVPMYEVQVPSVRDGSCGTPETCAGWWYAYGDNGGDWSPKNADGTLMMTDPMTGDNIPNGSLTATGLRISLKAPAASVNAPSIAGIGFDYNSPAGPSNITYDGGYFITYTSDTPLQLELGWDPVANGPDTWQVTLPAQATSSTMRFYWPSFKKEGWATGAMDKPITEATDHAWSLHIFLKNTSDTAKIANFELQSLTQ